MANTFRHPEHGYGPEPQERETFEWYVWKANVNHGGQFHQMAMHMCRLAASAGAREKRAGTPFKNPELVAEYEKWFGIYTKPRAAAVAPVAPAPVRNSFADRSQPPERDDDPPTEAA